MVTPLDHGGLGPGDHLELLVLSWGQHIYSTKNWSMCNSMKGGICKTENLYSEADCCFGVNSLIKQMWL